MIRPHSVRSEAIELSVSTHYGLKLVPLADYSHATSMRARASDVLGKEKLLRTHKEVRSSNHELVTAPRIPQAVRSALLLVWTLGLLGSLSTGEASASSRSHQLGRADGHSPIAGESTTQASAIILFIGDGMGEAQRTAASWSAVGRNGTLAMDAMPASGWSHTHSADADITDSAAAGPAIATGYKTNNRHVSVGPHGNPLTTNLERAPSRARAV